MKYGKIGFPDNVITAKNIIIATGSVPFVPKGIEVDGKHPFLLIPIFTIMQFNKVLLSNVIFMLESTYCMRCSATSLKAAPDFLFLLEIHAVRGDSWN